MDSNKVVDPRVAHWNKAWEAVLEELMLEASGDAYGFGGMARGNVKYAGGELEAYVRISPQRIHNKATKCFQIARVAVAVDRQCRGIFTAMLEKTITTIMLPIYIENVQNIRLENMLVRRGFAYATRGRISGPCMVFHNDQVGQHHA